MNIPGNSTPALNIPAHSIPEDEIQPEVYAPKSKTPEPMHFLASAGLTLIAYFIFDSLLKTIIGIAPILGVMGCVGLISHAVYLYHSSKPRHSLQWILWAQSCLLIAASIALIRNRSCP
jgi:hypothetical protein